MHGSGSDADGEVVAGVSVPPIVSRIAREIVRKKVLAIVSFALAIVVLVQAMMLLVIVAKPIARIYVSETTLLKPMMVGEDFIHE